MESKLPSAEEVYNMTLSKMVREHKGDRSIIIEAMKEFATITRDTTLERADAELHGTFRLGLLKHSEDLKIS